MAVWVDGVGWGIEFWDMPEFGRPYCRTSLTDPTLGNGFANCRSARDVFSDGVVRAVGSRRPLKQIELLIDLLRARSARAER